MASQKKSDDDIIPMGKAIGIIISIVVVVVGLIGGGAFIFFNGGISNISLTTPKSSYVEIVHTPQLNEYVGTYIRGRVDGKDYPVYADREDLILNTIVVDGKAYTGFEELEIAYPYVERGITYYFEYDKKKDKNDERDCIIIYADKVKQGTQLPVPVLTAEQLSNKVKETDFTNKDDVLLLNRILSKARDVGNVTRDDAGWIGTYFNALEYFANDKYFLDEPEWLAFLAYIPHDYSGAMADEIYDFAVEQFGSEDIWRQSHRTTGSNAAWVENELNKIHSEKTQSETTYGKDVSDIAEIGGMTNEQAKDLIDRWEEAGDVADIANMGDMSIEEAQDLMDKWKNANP